MAQTTGYRYDPVNSHNEVNVNRLLRHQPDWCLTPISGLVWRVLNPGDVAPSTIDFDYLLPNGQRLPDHPNLLQTSQRLVRLMRDGPDSSLHTGQSLANFANALKTLVCFMVLGENYRFDGLTNDDINDFCLRAKFGVDTVLDVEDRMDEGWANLTREAGFSESDSADQRREKALTAVPFKSTSSKRLKIDGFELQRRLGIESGKKVSGLVSAMLVRFEMECQSAGNTVVPTEDVEEELVTEEYLRRLLQPVVELYLHRRFLLDTIREEPFEGKSAGEVARGLGREVGRTKLPSLEQASTLIDRCARWVLSYASPLLREVGIEFSQHQASTAGMGTDLQPQETHPLSAPSSPFPLSTVNDVGEDLDAWLPSKSSTRKPNLSQALQFLSVACAVIIAVFSARRASEIRGLKSDCITFDESGRAWMRVYIHKTLQGEVNIPVPRIVVSAVRVLEALSRDAREYSGTEFLFQRMFNGKVLGLSKTDKLPNFGFGRLLRDFSLFVDTPPNEQGGKWIFRPHQFRKLFAVLYVWVYGGRLSTLSWFLVHNDLEMTWRYASDETLGQYIAMANRQRTATVLTQAALGQAEFKGPAARKFNELASALYDEYAQSVQVLSESRLYERIVRHVEAHQIEITGLLWGYCGHSRNAIEESACGVTADATPRERQEMGSLRSCGSCSLSFDTVEFRPFVLSAIQRHSKVVFDKTLPSIIRDASQCVVDACAAKLKSWDSEGAE